MNNPFRTRAKVGIVASKWYTVYYRKWWQRRWHTVMLCNHPYASPVKEYAENLAGNIEKGKIAV